MQINLFSISLWIIKRLSTFVCAYLPKQNQKGRECGHLLAGWRNELTLLSYDKDAFMEAVHCMEWVYSLLTDQRCGTPTTCYPCLSQIRTIYPHERPAKQTTKSTATTHSHLEQNHKIALAADLHHVNSFWKKSTFMSAVKLTFHRTFPPAFILFWAKLCWGDGLCSSKHHETTR